MEKIAVVGCGLIGQGWAVVFAQAGFEVAMWDISTAASARALESMETRLADMAEFDLVAPEEMPQILQRISVASSLEAAVGGALYVQENGPETLEAKREITKRLDGLVAEDVPIASSTSGIAASRYCEELAGRHRCLVVHPINPPHLIPAVEIVPTPWTGPEVVADVQAVLQRSGRETILLNQEIDGFVVNRLQGALLDEAFKLVSTGVVSAEDLDKAICDGLGLRWALMGPMQTIHLNAPGGIAQYVERYAAMFRGFGLGGYEDVDWAAVAEDGLRAAFEAKTPVDKIAGAQEARDRKLMALLRHKARP